MKCRECQRDLSAYVDDEVTPAVRAAIAAHVAGCENCRQRLEQLQQLTAGVAALPQLPPTPRFLTEVRRKLAEEEPVAAAGWVDWLFRPVWLKLPLEALAVIAVAATVLVVHQPARRPDLVARPVERPAEGGLRARMVTAPAAPVDRAEPPAAAPAPAATMAAEPRAVAPKAEPAPRRESGAVAENRGWAVARRLPTEEMELAKDAAYPLPVPPQVAPPAPPVATAEADRLTAAEVAMVLSNPAVLGPIVVVQAGDWTTMRRQVETTAAKLGGVISARPESQLGSGGRLVHTLRVRLPADQVGNFASQLSPISVQPRDGRTYQWAGETRGTSTAVAAAAASSAVLYRAPLPATDGKPVPVEVEVQIVPE